MYLAVPTCIGAALGMFRGVINIIYIGMLKDSVILAAVGLGNMILNICGLSIFFGFNSAIESLVSRAVGAG
jgi:Na+-driven multidrug efflux pump